MFSIFKRKEIEEPTLRERMLKLESRVALFEASLIDLATAQDIIRNKVLRKIQAPKQEKEESTTSDPYKGMFIPESS